MPFPGGNIPQPRWPARRELKLSDQYRAYYEAADTSARDDDPVRVVYLIVSRGERFLLTRKGEEPFGIIEIDVPQGSDPIEAARLAAWERVGAKINDPVKTGYLRCLATQHCRDMEPGSIHLRPVFVASAREVEDVPDEAGYERRTVNQRDLVQTIHRRHVELAEALVPAVSEWVKLHAQGKI